MNFIITYNISDSEKRTGFWKGIEDKFPNSSKETTNQTTVVGDTNKIVSNEGFMGKAWGILTSYHQTLSLNPWGTNRGTGYYVRCIKDEVKKTEKKVGLNKLIKKF